MHPDAMENTEEIKLALYFSVEALQDQICRGSFMPTNC